MEVNEDEDEEQEQEGDDEGVELQGILDEEEDWG